MKDDLSRLSAAEIDSLPFGYIAMAPDGTIRKYNRYEADLARRDPQEVLGKNFFREVAPCTQVKEFEGRFQQFVNGEIAQATLAFDFEFTFRHGSQKVRIGLVRSPLEKEVIVTVNRLRDLHLPTQSKLEHDPIRGLYLDADTRPVVVTGIDFWTALHQLYAGRPEAERRSALHQLGKLWGQHHALRVESFVQREHSLTLREVELQLALESLSGSLGVIGLGRFDVDLRFRNRGLLLVSHHASPFAVLLSEHDGERCGVLAGIFAGFFSYLAGRDLQARELSCSRSVAQPCRFVVGTESRLDRFFQPLAGSTDAGLWSSLGLTPPLAGEVDHG